jgi:hypothetical protein
VDSRGITNLLTGWIAFKLQVSLAHARKRYVDTSKPLSPYWKELGRRVHREVGQHLLGGSEGQVYELDDEVGPTVLIQ